MSEKQAVLPEDVLSDQLEVFAVPNPSTEDLDEAEEILQDDFRVGDLARYIRDRRYLLTLLQSLSDAGIEVVDGKVVNPWISAEYKKPQLGKYILFEVPSCYGVEKGMFHADRREPWVSDRTSPYNDLVCFSNQEVTWWMPLPAPPPGSAEEVKS